MRVERGGPPMAGRSCSGLVSTKCSTERTGRGVNTVMVRRVCSMVGRGRPCSRGECARTLQGVMRRYVSCRSARRVLAR